MTFLSYPTHLLINTDYGRLANLKLEKYSNLRTIGRIFYLLVISYGRFQDDNDEVTVPLLSA
jgi:hypothetical protein